MKAISRKKTRDHEATRVFSLTGNERYEGALQLRLEEARVATVHVAEASDAEYLAENDVIIFDAHAMRRRQSCGAALWVCRLREKDIGTPFIILTWLPRRDIVNAQLAGSPFRLMLDRG